MEKINAFLKKHGIITILIVMLLSFVNQCSIKNSIDRNTKYTKELVKEIKAQDSLIDMKMDSYNQYQDITNYLMKIEEWETKFYKKVYDSSFKEQFSTTILLG